MKRSLQIGDHEICDESDAFVIGSFWRSDFHSPDAMTETAEAAIKAGANALNLMWHNPTAPRELAPTGEIETLLKHFFDQNVAVLTTPAELSVLSSELTAKLAGIFVPFWLLRSCESLLRGPGTGKPALLQAGAISLAELRIAVDELMVKNPRLAILQSVATFRPRPEEINLRVISTLRDAFPEMVVGISERGCDNIIPIGAYALGARIVECGIVPSGTNDPSAMTVQALEEMSADLRRVGAAIRGPIGSDASTRS